MVDVVTFVAVLGGYGAYGTIAGMLGLKGGVDPIVSLSPGSGWFMISSVGCSINVGNGRFACIVDGVDVFCVPEIAGV